MTCGGYTNSYMGGTTGFPSPVVGGANTLYIAGDSNILKINMNTRMILATIPAPGKIKVMSVGKYLFCGTESGVNIILFYFI